ncbi:MAG: pyridoxal 5'-phosphate synthase glutaminase subunit PdxT [Chloroflexi bacterium]|nr:pyridoxal 5'-phosphate synthase glutaminase subunit PdxT [Chloroflexota bacterium]
MKIGVLAVQGAFIEHEKILTRIGAEPVEVRLPEHLGGLDGLIIPGGESTTIGKVAQEWGLMKPMRAFAESGRPLWGTCAGMILMAREVSDSVPGQPLLGLMDVTVRRNAFGRQMDSFEADLKIPVLGDSPFDDAQAKPFHAVFIRAPLIERVGKEVQVLARLEDGTAVAVRQGNLLATAFHPELTEDERFHRYFLSLVGLRSQRL